MTQEHQAIWRSNLIVSDIPWEYYLHPCPIFYAEELSIYGPTLWINPPTRNPKKTKFLRKNKNLAIFTPLILKRSGKDSGFGKLEVKLQTRLVTSLFLGSPSSVWSISTAYNHLVKDNPSACSIFWSGDFFCPEKEYKSYKNYDLVLCLTPRTHQKIPQAFSGAKIHFHMCSQLSEKKGDSDTFDEFPVLCRNIHNSKKVVGYVGTLSDRRLDFDLLFYLIDELTEIPFLIVGVGDGTESTSAKINLLKKKQNVQLIEGMEYNQLPKVISKFDLGLIPYKTDKANIGTSPTKFLDYSSMGKPTISTNLPGLEKFGKLISIAETKDEFLHLVKNFNCDNSAKPQTLKNFANRSSPAAFLEKIKSSLIQNHLKS